MSNVAVTIANHLLRIRAVFFRPQEPFTWASGIKSPERSEEHTSELQSR